MDTKEAIGILRALLPIAEARVRDDEEDLGVAIDHSEEQRAAIATVETARALLDMHAREERMRKHAPAMLDFIRKVAGGSEPGRWLDETGNECDKGAHGARFEEYTPEEQQLWLDTLAEGASRIIKRIEGRGR